MRALLINPIEQSVTEVEYTGDFHNIYTHIEADCFDIVRLREYNGLRHDVFVDDNGLIRGPNKLGYFMLDGYPQWLAGKGLILGTNSQGESVGATLPLAEARALIKAYGVAA